MPAFVEAQRRFGILRKSDAHARSDRRSRSARIAREPKFATRTKVEAVEPFIDAKRTCQTARTPQQVALRHALSAADAYRFETLNGLGGSQQDGGADAGRFACDVEAEMIAVDEVHVGVTAFQEHRAVTRRATAKRMRTRVMYEIRFRLNDSRNDGSTLTLAAIAHEQRADEEPREFDRIERKFGAREPARRRDRA